MKQIATVVTVLLALGACTPNSWERQVRLAATDPHAVFVEDMTEEEVEAFTGAGFRTYKGTVVAVNPHTGELDFTVARVFLEMDRDPLRSDLDVYFAQTHGPALFEYERFGRRGVKQRWQVGPGPGRWGPLICFGNNC